MWPEIWMMTTTNPCIVRRLIEEGGQQELSEDPPKKWETESGTNLVILGFNKMRNYIFEIQKNTEISTMTVTDTGLKEILREDKNA